MDDIEGFKTAREEVTADVVEAAREPVRSGASGRAESPRSPAVTGEGMLLREQPGMWCLGMGSTPGEAAVRTVGTTPKDCDHDVHLVDKAAAG